jgi:hypothetical protein
MKIITPNQDYIEKAKLLTNEDAERVHSRMSGKLKRRLMKKKLSELEASAIQLQREEEQLMEWREEYKEQQLEEWREEYSSNSENVDVKIPDVE